MPLLSQIASANPKNNNRLLAGSKKDCMALEAWQLPLADFVEHHKLEQKVNYSEGKSGFYRICSNVSRS